MTGLPDTNTVTHPLDKKYKKKPIALSAAKKGALLHYLDKGFPEAYRIWAIARDGRRKPKISGNRELIPIRLLGYEHHRFDGKYDSVSKSFFRNSDPKPGYMDGRYMVHVRTKATFKLKKARAND